MLTCQDCGIFLTFCLSQVNNNVCLQKKRAQFQMSKQTTWFTQVKIQKAIPITQSNVHKRIFKNESLSFSQR